jgi:hypothetical protein
MTEMEKSQAMLPAISIPVVIAGLVMFSLGPFQIGGQPKVISLDENMETTMEPYAGEYIGHYTITGQVVNTGDADSYNSA